jgi:hypothetical protein
MQQQGVPRDSLISGLCYSIVYNYLNRVVEDHKVGDHIFFQGGTAYNRGVKAAFEAVTGKKITVPPHHDVLGAIGCAIIAQEAQEEAYQAVRSTLSDEQFKMFQSLGVQNPMDMQIPDDPVGNYIQKRFSEAGISPDGPRPPGK